MNDEIILKYLADTLSEDERAKFESELKNDPLATERFEEMRRKFAAIRELAEVEPNNAYFDSINANSILKERRKSFVKKGVSWASAFAAFVLIFFIAKNMLQSDAENFMFSEDELQVVSQLTEYDLDARFSVFATSKYDFDDILENFDENIISENLDDYTFEYYQSYSEAEPYFAVSSDLSDEDFSSVLNELNNLKF